MLPAADRGVDGGGLSPYPLSELCRLEDTDIESVWTREAVVRIEVSLAFLDKSLGMVNREVEDLADKRLDVSLSFERRSVARRKRLFADDLVKWGGRSI